MLRLAPQALDPRHTAPERGCLGQPGFGGRPVTEGVLREATPDQEPAQLVAEAPRPEDGLPARQRRATCIDAPRTDPQQAEISEEDSLDHGETTAGGQAQGLGPGRGVSGRR